MRDDYYQLLDVAQGASAQEVRAAYRQQAMRYHPDRNADSPAAEERFKLIVEAWRTLGDEELRADYDAWLERRHRYAAMPELANMPRPHGRLSARNAERRREERRSVRGTHGARPRVSPFLMRRSSKVSGLSYVLISICFLSAMLPYVRHHLGAAQRMMRTQEEHGAAKLPPGESPLSADEQQKNLENFMRRLVADAESGNAAAQYNYGNILYFGNAGVAQDRASARLWWEKAAAQGHAMAKHALNHEVSTQDHEAPQEPESPDAD